MMLDECPLCKLVKDNPDPNAKCIVAAYNDHRSVILCRHDVEPTPEETEAAMKLLGELKGLVVDIDVAGHWGVFVKSGTWASDGKSQTHSTEPKK